MRDQLFSYRSASNHDADEYQAIEEFQVAEDRYPLIAEAAAKYMYFPVGSVDVERSLHLQARSY